MLRSDARTPSAASPAQLNQPFALMAGASATVETENLQIGFDRVLSDSRCPRGAQCITAGEAIVRIWVSKAPAPRETRDLTTIPAADEAVYGAYRIKLVSLDPYPIANATVRASEYVATLLATRS